MVSHDVLPNSRGRSPCFPDVAPFGMVQRFQGSQIARDYHNVSLYSARAILVHISSRTGAFNTILRPVRSTPVFFVSTA